MNLETYSKNNETKQKSKDYLTEAEIAEFKKQLTSKKGVDNSGGNRNLVKMRS